MDTQDFLAALTHVGKYARFIPELGRREVYVETVDRVRNMHHTYYKDKNVEDLINEAFSLVDQQLVLPSMRSMQFAGEAILRNHARLFNCSFLGIDDVAAWREVPFLLLSGCGVGYSVQKQDVAKLPFVRGTRRKRKIHVVGDTIEGWAEAFYALASSYFFHKQEVVFDYSKIRPEGTPLKVSGGKAPGHKRLAIALERVRKVFDGAIQRKLTPLECHDMMCHIADCVIAGGIRRSAMISLFSEDDHEMLTCKSGEWWVKNEQRARANNSVALYRPELTRDKFFSVWDIIKRSNAGEPGLWITNSWLYGTNPCQPGWAPVVTPSGIKRMSDIQIGDEIWSAQGWTKVLNKWSNGTKKVYRYRTTFGTFYGTENHRIVQNGQKIEAKDASAIDVLNGPAIQSDVVHDPEYVMAGLLLGDGTVHPPSKEKIALVVGKNDQEYFDSEISHLIGEPHAAGYDKGYRKISCQHITTDDLPRTFDRKMGRFLFLDKQNLCSVLRGIYSANGSVVANGSRITLKATSLDMILDVQIALSSIGISSYYTTNVPASIDHKNGTYTSRQSYDLNITSDRDLFVKNIGFIHQYKNDKINLNYNKNKTLKTQNIVAVDFVSEEEVFDITVDNTSHTYWTGGLNVSNCGEVALLYMQFCNLCTIAAGQIRNRDQFLNACRAAAILGTLQAGYTKFKTLRKKWQKNCEDEALLGISMTGIADNPSLYTPELLEEGARLIVEVNKIVAERIGIRPAARTTLGKPDGTSSLEVKCSSGVHARHAPYYMRRMRFGKSENITKFLIDTLNPRFIEDDVFDPSKIVLSVPVKSPEGSITRLDETAIDLAHRAMIQNEHWIKPGHNYGENMHNQSVTISIKENEWDEVGEYLWDKRDSFTGVSVLPYDGGTYVQAPFEDITEDQYNDMMNDFPDWVDFYSFKETDDFTNLSDQSACAGGACEVV